MKYLKILACLLGAVSVASCSNDDKVEYNTKSDVTVSLTEATIKTKENKGIIKVPVEVTGERNGYVTITCSVKEYGSEPAMSDVHYLLTSETINIEPTENSGYFEIRLVDDNEVNDPREFEVTLVSANGATLSGILETVITIKDNDAYPYDRLGGQWNVVTADGKSSQVTITAMDEEEEGYGQYVYISNLLDYVDVKMDFYYNEATEKGSLSIAYGQEFEPFEYGDFGRTKTAFLCYITEDNQLGDSGEVLLEWNESFTELKVASSPLGDTADLGLYVQFSSAAGVLGYVEGVTSFVK